MRLNILKLLNENFRIKVFAAFTLFIFVISISLTSLFIHHQSKVLTDNLIKDGKLLASVLAYNLRLGVFSENKELIEGHVEGIFQQEGILEVSVFNLDGALLKRKERPGTGTSEKTIEEDGRERHKIFEKMKEAISPLYLDGKSHMEFWAPVVSSSGYSVEESMFFDNDPLQRNDRLIGFVRITMDKGMLNKQFNDMLFKSILMGIIFLITGSGVTYILVKGITKPLNRLTEGVKTLGTGRDVEELPVATKDEIGELARAFNNMSESLKRREAALRESEKKYRDIFENAVEGIFQTIPDGRLISANPALARTFGFDSPQDMIEDVEDVRKQLYINAEDRARLFDILEKEGDVKGFEAPFKTKDGDDIWLSISMRAVRDEQGVISYYEGSVADITRRKQAEEALRVKESAIESTISAIGFFNLEGKLTYANPSGIRMWGYGNESELLGKSASDFLENADLVENILRRLRTGKSWIGQAVARRKDGSLFKIQTSVNPVKNSEGKPSFIMTSSLDISEQEKMKEHIIRSDKLAALGTLSAGLAHEIRNPLAIISSCAQFCLEKENPPERIADNLKIIYRSNQRAARMIEALLDCARPPKLTKEIVDIHEVLTNMHLRALLDKTVPDVSHKLAYAKKLPEVSGDEERLAQVFLNIYRNAAQAVQGKGTIRIETHHLTRENMVRVDIIDDGPGIPDAVRHRIFDPFFTTKDTGTGLGLSVSHMIVKEHGGKIEVAPGKGGGTVVSVYLPVAKG